MNNERYNQIIDEAYKNYAWKTSMDVDGQFTKEEFINKCKTDSEFSVKWGLKIEERELSLEERLKIYTQIGLKRGSLIAPYGEMTDKEWWHEVFDKSNVPRRAISLTYNNETIEVYV